MFSFGLADIDAPIPLASGYIKKESEPAAERVGSRRLLISRLGAAKEEDGGAGATLIVAEGRKDGFTVVSVPTSEREREGLLRDGTENGDGDGRTCTCNGEKRKREERLNGERVARNRWTAPAEEPKDCYYHKLKKSERKSESDRRAARWWTAVLVSWY